VSSVIGYKEWDVVCEALGSGRQALLLRKGGIHEGRAGFSFKHEDFVLFPTRFHAQGEQVRVPYELSGGEWEPGEEVPIRYRCEAVWARTLTDWDVVKRLEGFHVWSEDLVRERFSWGEEGSIHCALVKVSRLVEPWALPYEKKFGGCRTWVELPGGVGASDPVQEDEEFAELARRVEEIVGV
jgi:hypothetical protein